MIVVRQNIQKFIDLIKLRGDIELNEIILNISNNNMGVVAKTNNNVLAVNGLLFGKFENIGELGIGNVGLLSNFIDSFNSQELTIIKNKNKLILSSTENKLEIKMNLVNPEYIKSNIGAEKFQSLTKDSMGNEFTLTSDNIKKIISYYNTIKANDIILTGNKNILKIQLDELDNQVIAEFDLKETVKPFKIKFQSSYLINLLSSIDQDITISAYTNKFVYSKIENENYKVEFMLAPIEIKE